MINVMSEKIKIAIATTNQLHNTKHKTITEDSMFIDKE